MKLNQEIRLRLQELGRKDKQRRIFGAAAHNYQLNQPVNAAVVEAFERKHGISLPEDYVNFITRIGDGGAGPAYGLFPFGYDDEGRWGEVLPIGDPGQPFPYKDKWNLDEEFWNKEPDLPEEVPQNEADHLWEQWERQVEERYWNPAIMNGAIPICHLGCALRQWLVVCGEQKGYVWEDLRADQTGCPFEKSGRNPDDIHRLVSIMA